MPYKGKNGHIWALHSKEIFDICTWSGIDVLLPPFWKAEERIFAINLTYVGLLFSCEILEVSKPSDFIGTQDTQKGKTNQNFTVRVERPTKWQ